MVHYLIEAITAGIISLIIGTTLSVMAMYSDPSFKISKIDFWSSLIITNFLTGFLIHVIRELVGINKWYCKSNLSENAKDKKN